MPYRRRWQPCARNGVLFMAVTEQEFDQAEKRMTELRAAGHAVSARYDRRRARVVVALNTGVELTFPARLAEGLADADRKSTRLNSSHKCAARMPSSA